MLYEPMTLFDTATLARLTTPCLYCPAEVAAELGGTPTPAQPAHRYRTASTLHRCPDCGGSWMHVWSGWGPVHTLTVRDTFWATGQPPTGRADRLRAGRAALKAGVAALEAQAARLRALLDADPDR